MSLYARESMFEYMEKLSSKIFEVTLRAMEFYEEFFGHKYAFGKYDSIFCAEYNWGAMENAGLVTFNECYLFK